jgi:hypothetical protein
MTKRRTWPVVLWCSPRMSRRATGQTGRMFKHGKAALLQLKCTAFHLHHQACATTRTREVGLE